MTAPPTPVAAAAGRLLDETELHGHVAALAAQPRETGTPGERAAGERLARVLEALGFHVRRDAERVHGTYWWPIGLATGMAGAAGAAAPRALAALAGAAGALATADDVTAGPRLLRRLLPHRETVNVWTEIGPPDAARTVLVVAHHDAAHSGLVFEPELPRAVLRRLPERVRDRMKSTPPTMWGAVGGPALVALGALAGSRRVRGFGALLCAGYTAAMADIGLRKVVPGANDNATGVAVGLSLAHWLAAGPPPGVRVILLFPGAEESFMEGMVAWCHRHLHTLDPSATTVICLDTVGSPHLVALEGEGMLRMRPYAAEVLAELDAAAREAGVDVIRGLWFRNATDGLITLKRGFPTVMLGSVDDLRIPTNYHWPTDTADRVDHTTVADAARLCRRMIERLAAG
jgi:acetylornithine deacetylase/succinyl-diaminopimelate desuccinylase-like protein